MLQARKSASRTAARQLRWLLYAISLLLVGCLVHFGLQLKAGANALRRRAAFEHAIAGISMRFINAQPQHISAEIDRAISTMAECIGCDRAYLYGRPAPRSMSGIGWKTASRRAGRKAPTNWRPVSALPSVALSIFRRVVQMPPGENKMPCLPMVSEAGPA